MIQFLKENKTLIIGSFLFMVLLCFFLFQDNWIIPLIPFALLAIYTAIFHTEFLFLSLFLLTPLSINIEEYTDSFGLFLPTEPLLFGMLLLVVFQQFKKAVFPDYLYKNVIYWAVILYLCWMFITSLTSTNPTVSIKFLLVKLWFIVPILFLGSRFLIHLKNIRFFFWAFVIGMNITMVYTLIVHAMYNFGEDEGHWVMWPFFKDHTIYGAMVAFTVPMLFGLFFSKKHNPLVKAILIGLISITLLALFFSYTRAAWLSIVAAIFVWGLIYFKIKFSWILGVVILIALIVAGSWTEIQHSLAKNKYEHTTEDFGERLQSATNVTTDASNLERINRWTCAIDMFLEKPILGFGPGTYAFEYARFQRPENLTIISTSFGDGGNAHSEYLGPLAEMGIMGLITTLLFISAIFYKGITLYNQLPKKEYEVRVLVLSMILALSTYFVHGVLNNYLDTDKASVPIWACAACFIALEYRFLIHKNTNLYS
jgi:putative inorganic carbon (HCO3(-)) transporter